MYVSRESLFKLLLFIFLLNSAGFFSATFGMRGGEINVSSSILNRSVMLLGWVIGIWVIIKSDINRSLFVLNQSWALWALFLFACCSIFWSDLPSVSLTRLSQQFFLITFLYAISLKLENVKIVDVLIYISALTVVLGMICLVVPGAWQDIGYRGMHGHKNTAGYLYAISSIVLYYSFREKHAVNKYTVLLFVASIFLLFLTKSKTSLALSLISIAIIYLSSKLSVKHLLIIITTIWLSACFIYIGLLIIPESDLKSIGVNLTGRLIIWQFAISELQGNELLGVGYRAFWGVGETGLSVLYGEDYDAFITKLNQVHNSYLDIWVMLGWVGLFIFCIFIYHSFRLISKSNILFFSILLFLTCHSFMETDFFRSNNYLWVMYVLIYFSSIRLREVKSE
jgi:O-antigen ligase